jgi:hypothetical protein
MDCTSHQNSIDPQRSSCCLQTAFRKGPAGLSSKHYTSVIGQTIFFCAQINQTRAQEKLNQIWYLIAAI